MKNTTLNMIVRIAAAIAFTFVICAVVVWPVRADEHEHHHEHWEHHEHEHHHWHHDYDTYAGPVPNYYYAPPANYYYAPEPDYYYAPNGNYYAPPPPSRGINLFFGIP